MTQTENREPFHDPLESLERLFSHFDHQGVVIGGVAVSLLGQARFTEDLDAMLLLSVEDIPHFLIVAQKDLLDIQGIIQSQPHLDRERIQDWVTQFAELLERPELWEDIAGWL